LYKNLFIDPYIIDGYIKLFCPKKLNSASKIDTKIPSSFVAKKISGFESKINIKEVI
jgi:hypothetical protein